MTNFPPYNSKQSPIVQTNCITCASALPRRHSGNRLEYSKLEIAVLDHGPQNEIGDDGRTSRAANDGSLAPGVLARGLHVVGFATGDFCARRAGAGLRTAYTGRLTTVFTSGVRRSSIPLDARRGTQQLHLVYIPRNLPYAVLWQAEERA